ncbi:hypothetical protein CVIRNUC_009929 [Coccomyxa viridis]|uniref:RCC1-like domain-containing protein n=1 Tax=Coccomyxa viridis TaxID=1274662 RepID=A0AAV1IJT4_9CHLO|nr:hypothetical protein CVIRNUC_009929 [Coccomyxa viridis]
MAEPPGTSCAKRTVSRYLTNGQRKGTPSNAVGEDEASSPQRPPRSSSRRANMAPDIAASSPLWRVPWQPSPLASKTRTRSKASKLITGAFSILPEELLGQILDLCTIEQVGMLRATCRSFANCSLMEVTAQRRCQTITRAKGMKPTAGKKETWLDLLRCLSSQPQAAAQATAVSLGAYHTAALLTHSRADPAALKLYAFGRGFHGQLGNGMYSDQAVPTPCASRDGRNYLGAHNGRPAVVSAGSNHNLLITRRGEIFAWGLSSSGELGQRDTPIDQAWPVQVPNVGPAWRTRMLSVAAGGSHTLAICETGELWACGRGRHGQLGFGSFEDVTTMRPIASLRGVRIVAAAAGEKHSLALATHGAVYSWGCGRHGQLGVPEVVHFQQNNPGVQPAMHTPQFVRALDPILMEPWDRITSVAVGLNHNAAMSVAGDIYVWGQNKHGCLGVGDTVNRVLPTKVNLLQKNVPLKRALQACSGPHRWKQPRSVQVALGAMHTLILIYTPARLMLAAAGYNGFGQLGTGAGQACQRFTPVDALSNVATACIVSGENHACAVAKNGDLYFWGRGDSGQLGLGNDFSQMTPQKLPGFQVAHPDHTLRSPYSRTCQSVR